MKLSGLKPLSFSRLTGFINRVYVARFAMMVSVLFVIGSLAATTLSARQEENLFRPSIPWGEHQVGFSTRIVTDSSRVYSTSFLEDENYGVEQKAPRPVLVNVWYPAVTSNDSSKMRYGSYFELSSSDEHVHRWAKQLGKYAEEVACSETFGKQPRELAKEEAELWQAFKDSPTSCVRDAKQQERTFPLVVYHSGAASSFDDNSLLCEVLASFGYIVVGSAYPRTDGTSFNIDAKTGSIRDMCLLIQIAVDEYNADWNQVAYIGHSAGAQAVLRAVSERECPADAIVLLDSTVDYYGLAIPTFAELTNQVIGRASHIDEPMLVTAGPGAMFEMCDQLSASDRLYVTLPKLGHNEFISQGIYRLRILKRLPERLLDDSTKAELESAPVKEEYYLALLSEIREFVDSSLNGRLSASVKRAPDESGAVDHQHEIAFQFVEKGKTQARSYNSEMKRPPYPREVRQVIQDYGVERFCEWLLEYSTTHSNNAVYENQMLFGSLLYELGKDGEIGAGRQLHQTGMKLDINGVSTLRFLALMSRLSSKNERARKYLEIALQIAPDDEETKAKLAELDHDNDN